MLLLLRLPHPSSFWLFIFEVRFKASSLRCRLILHSDFLADYCWVGDSRLMMLDSSFWLCVRYPHWGIFPLFFEVSSCCWMIWLFLFMVIEMFDWFWRILYCTSDIHTVAYSPFIQLRWAPSGALSLSLGIFIDQRPLVEYVEMISVLEEHCWAHWQFSWS